MREDAAAAVFKPAIITPYHSESLEVLRRCHESCLRQTVPARHVMVADGKPRQALDAWDLEHLILPRAHGDYGNTPRGIGALSAINQGYNPILFLDADNWYAEDHVEQALACKQANPDSDVVASSRHLVLPDGTLVAPDQEDTNKQHIDTSCMTFYESSFFLLPFWCTMTKPLAVLGDRAMMTAMRQHKLKISWTDKQTLFYSTNYRHHYKRAGQEPPAETYALNTTSLQDFDSQQLWQWSRIKITLNKR